MARANRRIQVADTTEELDALLAAALPPITPVTASPRPEDDPTPPPLNPRNDPPPYEPYDPAHVHDTPDHDGADDHTHPHPKPERSPENPEGDPTPNPDPTEPDIEEGEDEDEDYTPNPSRPASPDPAGFPLPPDEAPRPAASAMEASNDLRRSLYTNQRKPIPPHNPNAITGEIMPRNARYEARISILDAFHYAGSLRDAPEWVDRNWIGYGDEDPLRSIPAGPCLRVPKHNIHEDVVLARVGDYVTRQEVRLAPGIPGDIRVEVWARDQFEKMFLPVAQ